MLHEQTLSEGSDIFWSNCSVDSNAYELEQNDQGNLYKDIYIAFSLFVDQVKTLVKVYNLSFSDFSNNVNYQSDDFNLTSDFSYSLKNVVTLCEVSNHSVIDVAIQPDSLWLLTQEDSNYSKAGSGLFKTSTSCSAPIFKSNVFKYNITRGSTGSNSSTLKCLQNNIWTLDDQLTIEKIEDAEHTHQALMTNDVVAERFLRKFGGEYIKDVQVDIDKNPTHFKR